VLLPLLEKPCVLPSFELALTAAACAAGVIFPLFPVLAAACAGMGVSPAVSAPSS
jgi:hypothetical protein